MKKIYLGALMFLLSLYATPASADGGYTEGGGGGVVFDSASGRPGAVRENPTLRFQRTVPRKVDQDRETGSSESGGGNLADKNTDDNDGE